MSEQIKIQYASGGASLVVRKIYQWDRGFMSHMDEASGGPKDSIRNRVFAIFESNSEIDRVVMVRAGGPVFLLMRAGVHWFDISGKQVTAAGPV